MKTNTIFFCLMLFCLIGNCQITNYDCNNIVVECIPSGGMTYQANLSCLCSGICAPPSPFTAGTSNTTFTISMLAFEASGTTVGLTLEVFNSVSCFGTEGFNVGIMDDCQGTCLIAGSNCGIPEEQISFDYDGLQIGRTYYIYIANCGLGGGDVELSINFDGNFSASSDVIDFSFNSNDCLNAICQSQDFEIEYDISILERSNELFFDITGPMDFSVELDPTDGVINFDVEEYAFVPGDYTICLTSILTDCNTIPVDDACASFSIVGLIEEINEVVRVCPGDFDFGVGEDLLGYDVTASGEYISNDLECDCIQQVFIFEEIELVREEILLELCPDDYPFVFLDEYVFEPSDANRDLFIDIEEGSQQYDYLEDNCDSLILVQIENAQCNFCELPTTLDDANIVLCIPFLDGAEDLSGLENEVNAFNLDFIDYSREGRRMWKGIFDGNGDYVQIPYAPLLENSIFSFSFEFEKSEPFTNGPVETIISMGSNNTLRYSIDLIETSVDGFDLAGTFYTENETLNITAPGLEIGIQYDAVFVVDQDVISLYLDGELSGTVDILSPLNVSNDMILLGAKSEGTNLSQFYEGFFSDFKYWAQVISGRDILFLHNPLLEFTEVIDLTLSCCEQAIINDSLIVDVDNPI